MFTICISMKIGIVGGGFVGGATALLKCDAITTITYDLDPSRCSPPGATVSDLLDADFVFVCVPTPTHADGSCNTVIVERCIGTLKAAGVQNIVLRSTVPPGTSTRLGVSFMPEFLTEANWRRDFFLCNLWVFAGLTEEVNERFRLLLTTAAEAGVIQSSNVLCVGSSEAETIKYVRNNFLATKISFFNEIAAICKAGGIDYDVVRQGVGADSRIGSSHTLVPGYDGHYGYGGTCLPKDASALLHYATSIGVESHIIKATVRRNRDVDRTEHDWESDPRAFTAAKL
jgi:UDPglucose 6-dehydrogenase